VEHGSCRLSGAEGADVERHAPDGEDPDEQKQYGDDQGQRSRELTLSVNQSFHLHRGSQVTQAEHERDVVADPEDEHEDAEDHQGLAEMSRGLGVLEHLRLVQLLVDQGDRLDARLASDERVAVMAEKLRALPSVESVETYQRWTERIARLLRGGVSASAVLALVVLVAVASVIGSTMRFALHRRRIEIEVLKLVGASDRFVRRPFLVEGAAQGALGAAASLVLLGVLYLIVRGKFDEELGLVFGVHPTFLPWEIALAVVATGGLLGTASAWAGVRRLSAE